MQLGAEWTLEGVSVHGSDGSLTLHLIDIAPTGEPPPLHMAPGDDPDSRRRSSIWISQIMAANLARELRNAERREYES